MLQKISQGNGIDQHEFRVNPAQAYVVMLWFYYRAFPAAYVEEAMPRRILDAFMFMSLHWELLQQQKTARPHCAFAQ